MEPLDQIVATFASHNVNFVVIGNYGARLHGVEVYTEDADMAFQRSKENHQRMMAALEDLNAHVRTGDDEIVFLPTTVPELFDSGEIWNLRTRYGDVDLLYAPAGGGYEQLLSGAEWVHVNGYPVLVASLDDIIRSKELADRPKDHQALPELYAFRDELQA